jgi:hypothetical protein
MPAVIGAQRWCLNISSPTTTVYGLFVKVIFDIEDLIL